MELPVIFYSTRSFVVRLKVQVNKINIGYVLT